MLSEGKAGRQLAGFPVVDMVQKHARGGYASRKGALGHPARQIQLPLRPHPVKNYVRQADRLGAGLKKLLPSAERTLHQAHNLMAAFQRDPAPQGKGRSADEPCRQLLYTPSPTAEDARSWSPSRENTYVPLKFFNSVRSIMHKKQCICEHSTKNRKFRRHNKGNSEKST